MTIRLLVSKNVCLTVPKDSFVIDVHNKLETCLVSSELWKKKGTSSYFIGHPQGLQSNQFYLTQNGRILGATSTDSIASTNDVRVMFRLLGGKGGFGSMLRAIGAQIEKTTNREACRDLSGRRLRDINEEKRLKTWLDGQKDRDQEAEEKRKRKIEKLQTRPKHEFHDAEYEQSRAELTQTVADSVAEGFRKAAEAAGGSGVTKLAAAKRSAAADEKNKKKKKKKMW